jgi:hypothetical protein
LGLSFSRPGLAFIFERRARHHIDRLWSKDHPREGPDVAARTPREVREVFTNSHEDPPGVKHSNVGVDSKVGGLGGVKLSVLN